MARRSSSAAPETRLISVSAVSAWPGRLCEDVGGDAGLDVDGDHRVGHDVVDLPGDAQRSSAEAALGLVACAPLALDLALGGGPLDGAATAHRIAEDQGDEEDAQAGHGVVAEEPAIGEQGHDRDGDGEDAPGGQQRARRSP